MNMTPDKNQLKRHIHKSDLTAMEKRYLEGLVDGEHVRHGKWIDLRESSKDVPKSRCSECGHVIIGLESSYNYCPNCGAKMDGESS